MACSNKHMRTALAENDAPDDKTDCAPTRMSSVLVVDDEPGILSFLQKGLAPAFGLVEVAADTQAADALLGRCHDSLVMVWKN